MVNKTEKDEKYITTSQAAEILGVSRVAVFKKIKKGEIPAKRIGRNYVILREDISPALTDKLTPKQKEFISDTTSRVVSEYGEALRRLAKE